MYTTSKKNAAAVYRSLEDMQRESRATDLEIRSFSVVLINAVMVL